MSAEHSAQIAGEKTAEERTAGDSRAGEKTFQDKPSALRPLDPDVAGHAAEMLALPRFVCGRRACRRANDCRFRFADDGEPCCLDNLSEAERAIFDALYDTAWEIGQKGRPEGPLFLSTDPMRRELEDAAVEIVRAIVHGEVKTRFDAFRRARDGRVGALAAAVSSEHGGTGHGGPPPSQGGGDG